MSKGSRRSVRFLVCILCLLSADAFASISARANALYSITVGQTVPDPLYFPDPGPWNGFTLDAGSYYAGTSSDYFSGGSWKPVPFGLQAVVTGPTGSYPVAPLPGDLNTWAMTLNSQGHVVGNSSTTPANLWLNIWQNAPQTDHAIFYSIQGGTIALRTLNGTAGLPMSINNADQIVGESYTPQGAIHGFITTPGGPAADLNSLIAQGSGFTIMAGIQIDDQESTTSGSHPLSLLAHSQMPLPAVQ
jgi:probable HAF family extracellular repeat protein